MNKPKILIVDDREENLVALEQLLSDLKIDIVRALSGNEAISKTLESEFSIALIDVQMPEMDGFETLELLRKNKQTENLPVIFVTATYHDEYHKIKGIESGAVDFLIKPIVPALLLGKIRVFLNLYDQRIQLSNTIIERDKALNELGSYSDLLEKTVEKRTKELKELNIGLAKEISMRKHTEDLLLKTKILLSETEKTGNIGGWVVDLETMTQTWTEETYRIHEVDLDFKPDVKKGISFYAPSARPIIERAFQNTVETGEPFNLELEFITAKGNKRWVHSVGKAQRENGVTIKISGSFQDITDRKQAEEALHRSEELNRSITQTAADAIISINSDGIILSWNNAAEKLYGYSTEKMLNKNLSEIIPKQYKDGHVSGVNRLKNGEEGKLIGQIIELKSQRKDGTEFPIELSLSSWETNNQIFYTGIIRDVTEQKKNEKELKKYRDNLEKLVKKRTAELNFANAELAKAAGMKDEFLANMSHELRTPLNAILGLSESLQEEIYGKLSQKQSEKIQHIEESGRHLLDLINEILDLAKIGAGKIILEHNRISIEELVQSSLRFIKQTAFNKKIKVSTDISATIETFRADEKRMKQILVNLLSNAVKFTPDEGQIGLEVDVNEENQTISFIVWDTGIGISPENLDKLFQPFVQIDSTLSRQTDGTGLGLALVNKLTKMHNGSITVESKEEKGSRFIVTIPINENAEG